MTRQLATDEIGNNAKIMDTFLCIQEDLQSLIWVPNLSLIWVDQVKNGQQFRPYIKKSMVSQVRTESNKLLSSFFGSHQSKIFFS